MALQSVFVLMHNVSEWKNRSVPGCPSLFICLISYLTLRPFTPSLLNMFYLPACLLPACPPARPPFTMVYSCSIRSIVMSIYYYYYTIILLLSKVSLVVVRFKYLSEILLPYLYNKKVLVIIFYKSHLILSFIQLIH